MISTGLSRSSRKRTDPASNVASSRGCGRSVMRPLGALSRWGDAGDDRVEQAVGGLTADLRLWAQQQAMPEGGAQKTFDVVRGDVVAALEGRRRLGPEQQKHFGPRARPQHQLR